MLKSKGAAVGGLMCLIALAAVAQENPSTSSTQTAPSQQITPAQPQATTDQSQAQGSTMTPPAAVKPEKAAVEKKSKVWGTIQSVDVPGRKITFKAKTGKGEVKDIALGETSKLTKGGGNKAINLADLKEGDYVWISMEGDVADTLHVNVAAKK